MNQARGAPRIQRRRPDTADANLVQPLVEAVEGAKRRMLVMVRIAVGRAASECVVSMNNSCLIKTDWHYWVGS